jgi:hypothetical protein
MGHFFGAHVKVPID